MAEGVRRGSISERRLSFSDSKFHRRTSNHNLTVDIERARRRLEAGDVAANPSDTCRLCPGHRDCDGPSQDQVIQEGKELFQNFLREEMQSRDLGAHLDLITPVQSPASGHKNPVWAKAGRELREMADEFSKTKERQRLRERAYRCTVFGFLLDLADWASMFFWVSKVTLRLANQVGDTQDHHHTGMAFSTDYNNNTTI